MSATNEISPHRAVKADFQEVMPGREGKEAPVSFQDQSTSPAPIPHLTRGDIEDSLPLYVLIVRTPSQRINRRVYLSLHSAVKATQRAEERGHAADLQMMRCVPYAVAPEVREAGDRDE